MILLVRSGKILGK